MNHNLRHAELSVLGASIFDPTAAATAAAELPADRYGHPEHRKLARAIAEIIGRGDRVTTSALEVSGVKAETVEEALALRTTTTSLRTPILAVTEAYMAREARRALERATAAVQSAERGDGDVFEALDAARLALSEIELGATSTVANADTHISRFVDEALTRMADWVKGEATDLAPTGFYSFDKMFGGIPVGELTTLAAETGMGKTSVICQMARSVARIEYVRSQSRPGYVPRPVLVFSAEMSGEQLTHRIATTASRQNLRELRRGSGDPDRHRKALEALRSLPIHVDQEPSPKLGYIEARIQKESQMSRTRGGDGTLALLVVDYDEKINTEGATEELRVSAIAQGLKSLAKRHRVATLALSQYARRSNAAGLPPSDDRLRYSGKKEQESAMIVHWHWPGYWIHKGLQPHEVYGAQEGGVDVPLNHGGFVVTKNRFGPVDTVEMLFDRETTTFTDPGEPRQ